LNCVIENYGVVFASRIAGSNKAFAFFIQFVDKIQEEMCADRNRIHSLEMDKW